MAYFDSICSNTSNTYCCQFRTELQALRSERDKAVLEADFARDRLNGFAAELEHQVLTEFILSSSFIC